MSAISKNLHQKYSTTFYFYTSKSINELIYVIGNPQSIQFEDLKSLYDNVEYLRRVYRMRTFDGRAEINQRINAVSKYYHDNYMLTCQHPLMFITNTKELFMKRQKKLIQLKQNPLQSKVIRHTKNNQQSSQISSSLHLEEQSQQQPKSIFLDDLSLSFDVLMNEEDEEYLDINEELDSSVHDVFQYQNDLDNRQDFIETNQKISFSKQILAPDEHKLSHLVCDFEDVDIDQAISFYKQIVKSKNGSAIMSQILEEEEIKLIKKNSEKSKLKQNILTKISFPLPKPPLPKYPKESVLQSYISIFGSKITKNNQKLKLQAKADTQKQKYQQGAKKQLLASKYLDQAIKKRMISMENEEERDEEMKMMMRQKSKTKIRQKAEQLLQKIKRQSFSVDLR